jgi:hypothetical protein
MIILPALAEPFSVMNLAQLLKTVGRAEEVGPELSSAFANFTKGLGTRDLKEAEKLLESI